MPEINHKGFAHFSFSVRSFPARVGGDDGDGVLDTATTLKIIVTTVTHRHAALKLALRQSFFLRECEYFHTGYDTREAIYLH